MGIDWPVGDVIHSARADVFGVGLFFEGGEDGAEFFVGGYQAGAAFGNQFCCPAGQGGKSVDVAVIALHGSEYAFELADGLVVGEFFNGCHSDIAFVVLRLFLWMVGCLLICCRKMSQQLWRLK